jgi:hypothetical protein
VTGSTGAIRLCQGTVAADADRVGLPCFRRQPILDADLMTQGIFRSYS